MFINKLWVTLCVLLFCGAGFAQSKMPAERALAFHRAKSLDNGVSISWLEQTWKSDILDANAVKSSDFQLLKQLGFKSIRLPVAFEHFESDNDSMQKVFGYIDEILKQCKLYGFRLIICYHSGHLNDNNYLTETPKVINLWTNLTNKYKYESPENLFFEIFNEPPHMDPGVWKDAAYNIVTAIHKIDKNRTLIVGSSNFNSIYELSRFVRLADENIIYTFHFYEPFYFTHQGVAWIGDQVATTGVPFPYDPNNFPSLNSKARGTAGEDHYNLYPKDGNERAIHDKLLIAKNWGAKYDVPLLCGEYGVYNEYADLNSRCRYIKAMRKELRNLAMPGILWDYNTNFSIFNGEPSLAHLPDCMKDAINYHGK